MKYCMIIMVMLTGCGQYEDKQDEPNKYIVDGKPVIGIGFCPETEEICKKDEK